MPVLTWPQPLPLCSPSLRIRLKRKKPSRACPKTVGCGRGGQGSCAQHSWSSSVPGRAPPAPTQARLPAKVQACPQVSHLLGAAGMAQSLQDTGQLCPAHLQKVVSAQWVGFKEAHEPVPVGNSTVPSERPWTLICPLALTHLGWGRWHSCVPHPASPAQGTERLCWAGTSALQRSWQHMELSHTHIERGDRLSPCKC